jgi:hypothetical protein
LKKAIIVVSLVEESSDVANCDLEEEIRKVLSEQLSLIPWAKKVQSVTVE